MKRLFWGFATVLAACATADEERFLTANGASVYPVSADVFEVVARPGNEINQFWCGAGEYASRALGAPNTARVYVVGEAGPGTVVETPNAMQFSLLPPEKASGATGRVSSWGPDLGRNEFVGDARRRCMFLTDLFFRDN